MAKAPLAVAHTVVAAVAVHPADGLADVAHDATTIDVDLREAERRGKVDMPMTRAILVTSPINKTASETLRDQCRWKMICRPRCR